MGHAQDAAALLYHAARVDGSARPLGHGDGFPRERCLIEHHVPLLQDPVQRQNMAGVDDDPVSGLHLRERDQYLCAVLREKPDLVHLQGHAPGQIVHGFFVRPIVQRFPQGEQKAHGARGGEVPGQKRGADGHAVQHLHGQLAPQKRLRGKPQAGHGADGIDDLAQRGGEKQLFPIVPQHLEDQLFLILPVDLAAAGAEHMRLFPRFLIGKAGQGAV